MSDESPSVSASQQKTVLITIPDLQYGGSECQTATLVEVLVGAGYRVVVACLFTFDSAMVSLFQRRGAEVRFLGLARTGRFQQYLSTLLLWPRLGCIVSSVRPDVAHVQYMGPGALTVLILRTFGVGRIIATAHLLPGKRDFRFLLDRCVAKYLVRAFICVSKAAEEALFGDSLLFSPNSIPAKRNHFTIYNPAPSTPHDPSQVKRRRSAEAAATISIGLIGRLAYVKGGDIVLRALGLVKRKYPGVKLIVAGDGVMKTEWQTLSRDLGLTDSVAWLGGMGHDEVLRLYQKLDVVVVPSRNESFGLTAAEALASGVPVVASDVGGLREVIDHGTTGYLVPVGDTDAFASAILALLNSPATRRTFGEEGMKCVRARFPFSAYRTSMVAVHDAVVAGSAG